MDQYLQTRFFKNLEGNGYKMLAFAEGYQLFGEESTMIQLQNLIEIFRDLVTLEREYVDVAGKDTKKMREMLNKQTEAYGAAMLSLFQTQFEFWYAMNDISNDLDKIVFETSFGTMLPLLYSLAFPEDNTVIQICSPKDGTDVKDRTKAKMCKYTMNPQFDNIGFRRGQDHLFFHGKHAFSSHFRLNVHTMNIEFKRICDVVRNIVVEASMFSRYSGFYKHEMYVLGFESWLNLLVQMQQNLQRITAPYRNVY